MHPRRRTRRLATASATAATAVALTLTLGLAGPPPATAADLDFQRLAPEQSFESARQPALYLPKGAPFYPAAKGPRGYHQGSARLQAGGIPRPGGAKVSFSAAGLQQVTLEVFPGRYPTIKELAAALRGGKSPELPTETSGKALFQATYKAEPSILAAYEKAIAALRADPASASADHRAHRRTYTVPAGDGGKPYLASGYQLADLQIGPEEDGPATHQLRTMTQAWVHSRGHPIQGERYGADRFGHRKTPWVSVLPLYMMGVEKDLDLPGPGVYVVRATTSETSDTHAVLVGDLDAVARRTAESRILFQAIDRSDGDPRGPVEVEVFQAPRRGGQVTRTGTRTDATGALDLPLATDDTRTLFALRQGDTRAYVEDTSGQSRDRPQGLVHLTTDRPVYKPGEVVRFRGVVRQLTHGTNLAVPTEGQKVTLQLQGRGAAMKAEATLDALGTFHGELELPRDARTGTQHMRIQASLRGPAGTTTVYGNHQVEVLAYRKPEHEVLVEPTAPWTVQGDTARVKVTGRYTVGGALEEAELRWRVRPATAQASPRGGFLCGIGGRGWTWWHHQSSVGPSLDGKATLDDTGHYTLEVPIPPQETNHSVRVEVDLISPDGRTVKGEASFYAPRAALSLGLRSTQSLVQAEEPWVVLAKAADLEGEPVAATAKLQLQRVRWEEQPRDGGGEHWVEVRDDLREWTQTIPAAGEAQWKIDVPKAGRIELIGTLTDSKGRTTTTKVGTYRYGDDAPRFRYDRLELAADQDEYRPGDTARVLVRAPMAEGTLWWSLEGSELRTHGSVPVRGYNAVVTLPLTTADAPEAKLHVETRKQGQTLAQDMTLEVRAVSREATVTLETDRRVYQPGDEVSLEIDARTPEGKPAQGVLCLAVVDEALEQVATDRTPDPYQTFYGSRRNRVRSFGRRLFPGRGGSGMPMLGRNKRMAGLAMMDDSDMSFAEGAPQAMMARSMSMPSSAPSAPGGGGGGGAGSIRIRKDFRDIAYWVGTVPTDHTGSAELRFRLPDDLSRWRLVAYWVDAQTRVAKATTRVVARKDLMVRLGLPRFLVSGDHVLVKAAVQNATDEDQSGTLTFQTPGVAPVPLSDTDLATLNVRSDPQSGWLLSSQGPVRKAPHEYSLNIPARRSEAVDFPIYVHGYPASGELPFRATITATSGGDALERKVPVLPFGRRRTEVTLGKLEKPTTTLTIERRPGTAQDATEVDLDLMLSLDQAVEATLVSDLESLLRYRYGCTEQTLSRFLPLLSAQAYLDSGWLEAAGLANAARVEAVVEAGVERLKKLRNGNGWGWSLGDEPSVSITAYLLSRVHRLPEPHRSRMAKELDLARSARWLRTLYQANADTALSREEKSHRPYRVLALFRAYEALALAGEKVRPLPVPELEAVRDDPRFWVSYGVGAAAQKDATRTRQAVTQLARLTQGNQAYRHWRHAGRAYSWYADDAETSALALEFLADAGGLGVDPGEAYEPALRWLVLGPGARGYRSTKGRSAAAALAARHLKTRKPQGRHAPVTVEVRAGRSHRREVSPDPRARRDEVRVLAPELVRAGGAIEVRKGPGPDLLARIETTRFETGPFEPLDQGFAVRSSLSLAGAVHPSHEDFVRTVEVKVPKAHTYAVLEVPLISGAEVDTKGEDRPVLERRRDDGTWSRTWHQADVLDDRVVFYLRYLAPGTYRARVPMNPELAGFHNMLPARAFLMYYPEIEGASESHRVRIGRED